MFGATNPAIAKPKSPAPPPLADEPEIQCLARLHQAGQDQRRNAAWVATLEPIPPRFPVWAARAINRAAIARKIKADAVVQAIKVQEAALDATESSAAPEARIAAARGCMRFVVADELARSPLSPAVCTSVLSRRNLFAALTALSRNQDAMVAATGIGALANIQLRFRARILLRQEGMDSRQVEAVLSAAEKDVSRATRQNEKRGLLPEWDVAGCDALLAPPPTANGASPH